MKSFLSACTVRTGFLSPVKFWPVTIVFINTDICCMTTQAAILADPNLAKPGNFFSSNQPM